MLSCVSLFRVRPKSYRVKAKSIPEVNWGYAGDEFDTTDLFGFSLTGGKCRDLRSTPLPTCNSSTACKQSCTSLAIFHPRLILETSSSSPHQLFCLRKEQDPEELFSNLCCNIQSECYYQLLETDSIENTDDVCIV